MKLPMVAKVNAQFRVLLLCGLALSGGCNSLLGNERVQSTAAASAQVPEPERPDSGAGRAEVQDGGSTERGSDAASRAEASGSGGRRASKEPDAGGSGGMPADPDAGKEARGASPAGSAAADSGAGSDTDPQPDSTAIRGTVVDSYRRPVSGARVWLGAQSIQTDAEGKFSFDSAASSLRPHADPVADQRQRRASARSLALRGAHAQRSHPAMLQRLQPAQRQLAAARRVGWLSATRRPVRRSCVCESRLGHGLVGGQG